MEPPRFPLPVETIAAGAYHNLAALSDGSIVAWGFDQGFKVTTVPPDLTNVTQLAAGYLHNLALLNNGKVVQWGSIRDWDVEVPRALRKVTAIAIENHDSYTLAITTSIIKDHPVNASAAIGGACEFTVLPFNTNAISYQWLHNGKALDESPRIRGTRTPKLIIENAQANDEGNYSVVVGQENEKEESISGSMTIEPSVGWSIVDPGPDFEIFQVETDSIDNLYVAGRFEGKRSLGGFSFNTSNPRGDGFVAKLDSKGKIVWVQQLNATAFWHLSRIAVDEDGAIYMCGWMSGSIHIGSASLGSVNSPDSALGYVVKLDSGGKALWAKSALLGGGAFNEAIPDKTGGAFVTGGAIRRIIPDESVDRQSGVSLLFAQFSPVGSLTRTVSCKGEAVPTSILLGNDRHLHLIGVMQGPIDFGDLRLTPPSNASTKTHAFWARVNTDGKVVSARIIATAWSREIFPMRLVQYKDALYFAGTYSTEVSFNMNPNYTKGLSGRVLRPGLSEAGPNAFLSRANLISGELTWVEPIYGAFDLYDLRLTRNGTILASGICSRTFQYDSITKTLQADGAAGRYVMEVSDSGQHLWSRVLEERAVGRYLGGMSIASNGDIVWARGGVFLELLRFPESASPVIVNSQISFNNLFQANVIGEIGKTYVIEGSSDLQHWTRVKDLLIQTKPQSFQENVPTNRQHLFYRLRMSD